MNHVPIISVVVFAVAAVAAVAAAVVAEVIVTDAQNLVISLAIVPNPITAITNVVAVAHPINKVEMMMKIR